MLKSFKSSLYISAFICAIAVATTASAAEISGNIGVTSDYIWRGYTQNSGMSSVSGGLDVDFGNGFYARTWVGDATYEAASYELDFYAGYAGEAGPVSYDVGYLAYMYPDQASNDNIDFSEIYATVGYGLVSASYYYLASADAEGKDAGDDTYLSLDLETSLSEDIGLALHYGTYEMDGDDDTDSDMSLTISKGDFSLAFIQADGTVTPDEGQTQAAADDASNDDDLRVVVSWGTSF